MMAVPTSPSPPPFDPSFSAAPRGTWTLAAAAADTGHLHAPRMNPFPRACTLQVSTRARAGGEQVQPHAPYTHAVAICGAAAREGRARGRVGIGRAACCMLGHRTNSRTCACS